MRIRSPNHTKLKYFASALIVSAASAFAPPALASDDCMIGEVKLFAGNFAPRNWSLTNGQLLAVSQNTALFSVLGTMYGGDGRTTFGLPDLRGRTPVGAGNGPGLSNIKVGQKVGSETANLPTKNLKEQKNASVPFVAGGPPVPVRSPGLGMHYIICLSGLYPSRS